VEQVQGINFCGNSNHKVDFTVPNEVLVETTASLTKQLGTIFVTLDIIYDT
jgi:hypothetical protein